MKTTTVVIPTYNEAQTMWGLLQGLRDCNVIVVDDASTDGTRAIVRQSHATLIPRDHKMGIASALLAGFRAVLTYYPATKYIVQMDAGGTHNPADVGRMLLVMTRFPMTKLVIGSRFIKSRYHTWHWKRTPLSRVATWLMCHLPHPKIDVVDATSGFRCWNKRVLLDIISWDEPFLSQGFAFQLETLCRAAEVSGDIAEISIDYKLTNSTLDAGMIFEAMYVYARLFIRGLRWTLR